MLRARTFVRGQDDIYGTLWMLVTGEGKEGVKE